MRLTRRLQVADSGGKAHLPRGPTVSIQGLSSAGLNFVRSSKPPSKATN